MLTLITAVPGSGKTLFAISLIEASLKTGRPVYTNINGLVVEKFTNPHLLFPAPDDWRDTPEGSLVIYDEAQQPHLYPSNAQRGPVSDPRLTAMETHRHSGHDIVFITQAPSFVHHHIRKLIGSHIHLYRARGVEASSRYEWSHVCDSPNDRKEQERADFQLWKFPREHFSYYTSAVIHTHKFRMPRKLAILGSFLLIAVVLLGYRLYSGGGLQTMKDDEIDPSTLVASAVVSAPAPVRSQYAWSETKEAVPVSGCIANHDRARCQCFSATGVTLDLSHAQCLSVLDSPLPRSFKAPRSENSSGGQSG